MKRLTQEQRDHFEASLKKWQEKLNLRDWGVTLAKQRASSDAYADVVADVQNRAATIRLGSSWNDPSDREIEAVAVHEMLHIFLAELIDFAKQPGLSVESITSIEHRAIKVIETLLVPAEET